MIVHTHPTDTEAPLIVERSPEEKRFNLVLFWSAAASIVALVGVIWSAA